MIDEIKEFDGKEKKILSSADVCVFLLRIAEQNANWGAIRAKKTEKTLGC